MKSVRNIVMLGVISLLLVSCVCKADAVVQHGDSYDAVIALLGQPEGYMVMEDTTWLNFDRGTVKLVNNRVVEASLVSVEQARLRKAREQAEREHIQRMRAEQNAKRLEEGRALKQARLNDPTFLSTSAFYQASYWREFQRLFPEISVNQEYAIALARHEAEQQRMIRLQEQEQRIRELESRVRIAENRAERSRAQKYYSSVVYMPAATSWIQPVDAVHCTPQRVVTRPHNLFTSPTRHFHHSRHPGLSVAARLSF